MLRALIVFIDGVGVGAEDQQSNPFCSARIDTLAELLAGKDALFDATTRVTPRAVFTPVDASLGVLGLPQSGTGQTALFAGFNAAREFGRHFGPWVPTALRARLANENLLTKAKNAGLRVAFANAYPEELFSQQSPQSPPSPKSPPSPLRAGPPIVALGAGVLTRHTNELMRGDAVASEITNEGWRKHLKRTELPVITAAEAGRNLARIAAQHDLTLFAHYSTDYVGHRGHMWEAVEALQKVDDFVAGVLAAIPEDTLVAVVSDHGNIEDIRVGHTHNPALGIFLGPQRERFAQQELSLADIAPAILELLGVVDRVA